jgi:molybdopterin-synthase adenylyltransferase
MLSQDERQRYERQLLIRGIGEAGQDRLKQAKVVIAGAGGLGIPAALYLAAAGIGTIRIIDSENVDISHLNRQVLHWTEDVGRPKLDSLCEKLRRLNDQVEIEAIYEDLTEINVVRLTAGFSIILDGTDDLETRFLLNTAALENRIPFVHGAVFGFEGRLTTIVPGHTPCLRCLYRGTNPQQKLPVIGVTQAVIGSLQATETIKYVVGMGHLLTNQLLVYNGLKMRFGMLAIKRDPTCKICSNVSVPVGA